MYRHNVHERPVIYKKYPNPHTVENVPKSWPRELTHNWYIKTICFFLILDPPALKPGWTMTSLATHYIVLLEASRMRSWQVQNRVAILIMPQSVPSFLVLFSHWSLVVALKLTHPLTIEKREQTFSVPHSASLLFSLVYLCIYMNTTFNLHLRSNHLKNWSIIWFYHSLNILELPNFLQNLHRRRPNVGHI